MTNARLRNSRFCADNFPKTQKFSIIRSSLSHTRSAQNKNTDAGDCSEFFLLLRIFVYLMRLADASSGRMLFILQKLHSSSRLLFAHQMCLSQHQTAVRSCTQRLTRRVYESRSCGKLLYAQQ